MTYFPKITTSPADGPGIDAFGRLRSGNPETLFDSKQILSAQPLLWSSQEVSGGMIAWQTGRSSTLLTVTSSLGSKAIRQTRRRFNYQPGKSMLINQTFVMGSSSLGFQKQVGYFDEQNGIFSNRAAAAVLRGSFEATFQARPSIPSFHNHFGILTSLTEQDRLALDLI